MVHEMRGRDDDTHLGFAQLLLNAQGGAFRVHWRIRGTRLQRTERGGDRLQAAFPDNAYDVSAPNTQDAQVLSKLVG
jgi:hypothetical protein